MNAIVFSRFRFYTGSLLIVFLLLMGLAPVSSVAKTLAASQSSGQPDQREAFGYASANTDAGTTTTAFVVPLQAGGFNIDQTLSDEAQRNTIAFDGLAFLTGTLGSDSFFPPGKVADFWGFQFLRDNDPSEMGHNTDFLTKASLNMLYVLTSSQRTQLITLAQNQVDDINQYGMNRFVLMKAFRRLLDGDLPAGTTGLNLEAVKAYSAELYRLDGEISYERAQLMGTLISNFTSEQRAYLDAMVGKGMLTWPTVTEPAELRGLTHDVKVAVMTYAGDMFSWYAGSIEADVYFCPERQGTYFGSFYMKDAPAVGNPGYTIPSNLTSDMGEAFLKALTAEQAASITSLVEDQKPALYEIVDRREDVSTLLRQFMTGGTPNQTTVLDLMERYGELDGEIIYRYATAFTQVNQSLSADQQAQLMKLRTDLLEELAFPAGAYLYAEPISMPVIPNTDFLFLHPATQTPTTTATNTPTNTPTVTATPTSTPTLTRTPTPTTLTFTSIGVHDGWVLEKGENLNMGGSLNASSATLRLGDDYLKRQYRSIISFDTSSLPGTAVITSVTLKLKGQSVTGGATFNMFQGLLVDIRKGPFDTAALQTTDFEATADKSNIGPFTVSAVGGWYTFNLTSAQAFINKATTNSGLTQFRLRFKLDDNNNAIANYISFFSGDSATNKPILIIQYNVP